MDDIDLHMFSRLGLRLIIILNEIELLQISDDEYSASAPTNARPFTYHINGMLGTGLTNSELICAGIEYSTFDP